MLLGEGWEGKGRPNDLYFRNVWLRAALACRMELLALRQQKKEQELIEDARKRGAAANRLICDRTFCQDGNFADRRAIHRKQHIAGLVDAERSFVDR